MKKRKEGTVKLDVIAVKAFVNYVYSGINALMEYNVEETVVFIKHFEIVWVKEPCVEFLKSNVDRKSFRMGQFADKVVIKL